MIGIIGGMGAAASAHFYQQLIAECQLRGAKEDNDFPEIILHNLPAKGMDETGVKHDHEIKEQLKESVAMLNACGCDRIAIICNTVHLYLDELQESSQAEILNMVKLVVERVTQNMDQRGNVGVISSSTTKLMHLYEDQITKTGNHTILTTIEQQIKVDNIIKRMISGEYKSTDFENLYWIYRSMKEKGADAVILGCTELPLAVKDCMRKDIFVDPAHTLIDRLLS